MKKLFLLPILLLSLISTSSFSEGGLTSKDYSIKKGSILGSKNSLKLTPMSSAQLTPIQIFNYFPLCKIRSSYGPKCKSFSLEKNNKYSPSQIKNIEIMTIKRNELEITTDSWFYYFSLQREGDGKYSLQFTDDALKANLLVFKTFYLIWEAKIHNWTIVGERLDYSRGITPERSEGKYKSFDEPIPFLSSK